MLDMIIEVSREFVTGYSSTNTTTNQTIRDDILTRAGYEDIIGTEVSRLNPKKEHGKITLLAGGISGNELLPKQLDMTAKIRRLAPEKAIIGIGGIGDEESAAKTFIAGAQAVALYSRLAQDGPGVIPLINI